MKNIRKVALSVAAMLAVEGHIWAQSDGSMNFIVPATFSMISNISFGSLSCLREKGDTVIVRPDNAGNKINTSKAPASFSVSGIPGYTFGITVPDVDTITDKNSTIIISDFTSSPAGTGILSVRGTRMIKVGATLTIHTAKKPDHFTSDTDMPVTVHYN